MKKDVLEKLQSVSLMARVLREHQKATTAPSGEYSDRELLILELVGTFGESPDLPPLSEKAVCTIFGLSPSTCNDAVKRLIGDGLLEKAADSRGVTRGMAMQLTEQGENKLSSLRGQSAARLAFLFTGIKTAGEWDAIEEIVKKINGAVTRAVKERVFGIYDVDALFGDATEK